MYQVWDILEHSALNGRISSNLFPQGSGVYAKEEVKRCWELKILDDIKEIVFARHSAHTNLQRLGSTPKTSQVLSAIDTLQQKENKIASMESLQMYKPHLRVGTMFRTGWPTENELHGSFEDFCFVLALFVLLVFYLFVLIFIFVGVFWGGIVGFGLCFCFCFFFFLDRKNVELDG